MSEESVDTRCPAPDERCASGTSTALPNDTVQYTRSYQGSVNFTLFRMCRHSSTQTVKANEGAAPRRPATPCAQRKHDCGYYRDYTIVDATNDVKNLGPIAFFCWNGSASAPRG